MRARTVVAALSLAVLLTSVDAARAQEVNLELPLPSYAASASSFIARTTAIRDWVKKAILDPKDGRLYARLRTVVARRSAAPAWTNRTEPWSDTGDYTVHFAVGKVTDFQEPVAALTEAERRARAAAEAVAGGGKAYVLDWYMNDDGVTWAIVGAVEPAKPASAEEPPAVEAPVVEPPAVEAAAESATSP